MGKVCCVKYVKKSAYMCVCVCVCVPAGKVAI